MSDTSEQRDHNASRLSGKRAHAANSANRGLAYNLIRPDHISREMPTELERESALLLVHVQKDFCPGGALPVPHGDEVVAVLNHWIHEAQSRGARIYGSRDWHPPNHSSFREQGGPWPPHCVQNSRGAELHPDLNLPEGTLIVDNGSHQDRDNYSAFDETELAERLRAEGVKRLWVGGLAEDYCVLATVLDGLKEGFEVHLIENATRPVDVSPGDGARALARMRAAGAVIEP